MGLSSRSLAFASGLLGNKGCSEVSGSSAGRQKKSALQTHRMLVSEGQTDRSMVYGLKCSELAAASVTGSMLGAFLLHAGIPGAHCENARFDVGGAIVPHGAVKTEEVGISGFGRMLALDPVRAATRNHVAMAG
jgi:hypothetical protein